MKTKSTFSLASFGLGIVSMFFLDPSRGRRRRHVARDKIRSTLSRAGRAAAKVCDNLQNRSFGFIAELAGIFRHDQAIDEVIAARVRSKLGRLVSNPHAIRVTVRNGRVNLSGPVLAGEVDDLLTEIHSVR